MRVQASCAAGACAAQIVHMDTKMGTVSVAQPGNSAEPPKSFTFDQACRQRIGALSAPSLL
eukprot:4702562-Pleurochrysis_carterae.AAC.5